VNIYTDMRLNFMFYICYFCFTVSGIPSEKLIPKLKMFRLDLNGNHDFDSDRGHFIPTFKEVFAKVC